MRGAGYNIGSALQFLLLLDTGALVGALVGGWLAARVFAGVSVLAGISILFIPQSLRAESPGINSSGVDGRNVPELAPEGARSL